MKADSAGHERGQFSRIPLSWDEASRTLTLGPRAGAFEGMIADRTFTVVVVSPDAPIGYSPAAAGKAVAYRGDAVQVTF